jgi:two-component sensor histidine kinase
VGNAGHAYYLGMVVPISLSENEAYSALFDGVSDAVLLLENSTVVACNAAALTLLAYHRSADLEGIDFSELSPKKRTHGDRSGDAEDGIPPPAETSGTPVTRMFLRGDGSAVATETTFRSVHLGNRRLVQVVARESSADATALESISALAAATPDLFYSKDGNGRWLHANPAAISFLALDGIDYIGKTDEDLGEYLPNHRVEVLGSFRAVEQEAWNTGETTRVHTEARNARGTLRTYDMLVVPTFLPNGDRKRLVSLSRDISEIKSAAASLERTVADKSRLLGELHHRVKNNLSMVSTLLAMKEMSLDGSVTLSDIRSRVETISAVHDTLSKSSDDLSIDLADYLVRVVDAAVQNAEIARTVDARHVVVGAKDAVAFGLIVNELVSNAARYAVGDAPDAGISVGLYADAERGGYRLLVSGNGAAPEDPEVLVDGSDRDGLAARLVRSLTDQLSGTIEVSSDPYPAVSVMLPTFGSQSDRTSS